MAQISKSLRFEILRRDGFTCQYCGAKAPDAILHVDHVMPEALGGPTSPENLVSACVDCNSGKATKRLDDETVHAVDAKYAEWRDAVRQAAEDVMAMTPEMAECIKEIEKAFRGLYALNLSDVEEIKGYADSGLPLAMITDAAWIAALKPEISGGRRTYGYFRGVCDQRLRDIHTRARYILEAKAVAK